jgi:hypothetical protein
MAVNVFRNNSIHIHVFQTVLGAYGHNRPRYLNLISDEALILARLTTRPILVYRDKGETK